ncbi:MAG: preprotein translocase subunit SecG [Candidatus Paceibacteria bacterium]
MSSVENLISIVQVVLAILLVGGILLQQRGAGLGGAFGGGEVNQTYYTRRGAEKFLFRGTIVVAILFALSVAIMLFI